MDTEVVWKRLVAAATRPTVIASDRERRALLSEAMTVGTSITADSIGCSITETVGTAFRTPVASGPLALDLDSAQYADDDGPCIAACRDGREHSITVMAEERSYREFTHVALSYDVRSSLSLPLIAVDRPSALNLYARSPSAFDPPRARAVAALLARCTAAILSADPFGRNVQVLPASGKPVVGRAESIANPQYSARARTIASALLSLRERDGLDQAEAFDALIRLSRQQQRSILAVSRDMLTDSGIDRGADT